MPLWKTLLQGARQRVLHSQPNVQATARAFQEREMTRSGMWLCEMLWRWSEFHKSYRRRLPSSTVAKSRRRSAAREHHKSGTLKARACLLKLLCSWSGTQTAPSNRCPWLTATLVTMNQQTQCHTTHLELQLSYVKTLHLQQRFIRSSVTILVFSMIQWN